MSPEQRQQKLAEARAKFGKPFAHEINAPRLTKPSVILQEIERRQQPETKVLTVVNIREKNKK